MKNLLLITCGTILCASVAVADSFKCGAEALNTLAGCKIEGEKTTLEKGEFDKLLEEIKEDDFASDKAREVALNKAKTILKDANWVLPKDTARPVEALTILADDASMSDVAYSVLLQKENVVKFSSLDPDGIKEWLYGTAAGIQKGEDGSWDDFELAPVPDKRLSFVEASRETPKGCIKSAWKYENGKCNWRFTIPAGLKATVCVNGMCMRYESGEHNVEIKSTQE